jgi:hypothetical protein
LGRSLKIIVGKCIRNTVPTKPNHIGGELLRDVGGEILWDVGGEILWDVGGELLWDVVVHFSWPLTPATD